MNEKDGAIRDASVLGVPKMLILGLQHMFAMFGATILVPILVNSYFGEDVLHVQVTLICAGIGTLFFHLCSKFKVPAFLGSSFAFLGGFATIANMDSGVFADMSNADKLSYACGGIVVAGLLYLILALIIKLVGVKTPEKFRHHAAAQQRKYSAFRAMSPYIYMLVLLVRYGFPAVVPNGFAVMCTFGYIFWVDVVILVCGMLGAATLGVSAKQYRAVCSRTVGNVLPVLITMGSLLIVSYIMQSPTTGMMNLLATDIARVVGRFYPAAAVLIGSSGAFITGTGLGSNIMFAQMHIDAAASLGMNPITIFAGQNAGASLGNLICPNNTVAACATVDQVGNESEVMKKTFKAFAIILVLYMVLAMLYTCVLFPNFGM